MNPVTMTKGWALLLWCSAYVALLCAAAPLYWVMKPIRWCERERSARRQVPE